MQTISMRDIAQIIPTNDLPYILPKDFQAFKVIMEIFTGEEVTDEQIKDFIGMPAALPVFVNGQKANATTAEELFPHMATFVKYTIGDKPANETWRKMVNQWDTNFRKFLRLNFVPEVLVQNGNTVDDIDFVFDSMFPALDDDATDEQVNASVEASVQFLESWMNEQVSEEIKSLLSVEFFDFKVEDVTEEVAEVQPVEEIDVVEEENLELPVSIEVEEDEVKEDVNVNLPVSAETSAMVMNPENVNDVLVAAADVMKATANLMEALSAVFQNQK